MKDKGVIEQTYLKQDPDYDLEIIDYNLTHIKYCANSAWNKINVPLELYAEDTQPPEYNEQGNITKASYNIQTTNFKQTYALPNIQTKCGIIETSNIVGKTLKWGHASTPVTWNYQSSAFIEDTTVMQQNPTSTGYNANTLIVFGWYVAYDHYVYLLFRTNTLPSDAEIIDADIYLFSAAYNQNYAVQVRAVRQAYADNYGSLTSMTFNNQPCYDSNNNFRSTHCNPTILDSHTTSTGWQQFDITSALNADHADKSTDYAMYILEPSNTMTYNTHSFRSLEWRSTQADTRPYLQLDYNIVAADDAYTYLISPDDASTTTSSTVTFDIDVEAVDSTLDYTQLWTTIGGWNMYNQVNNITGTTDDVTWTITNIPDGTYEWNAYTCNIAASCNWAADNYTITVNSVAPNNPASVWNNTPPDFNGLVEIQWQASTSSDLDYYIVKTNGTNFDTTATRSMDVTGLDQNEDHLITVHAVDTAGNENTAVTTNSVTVSVPAPDTTPPDMTVTTPTDGATYTSTTINIQTSSTASDVSHWHYKLGGGWVHLCSASSCNENIVAQEGSNFLEIRVFDTAQPTSNFNTTNLTFTVDTTAPSFTIDSPTSTTYTTAEILLNISSDTINTTWYSNNSGTTNTTFDGNETYTWEEGTNTVYVWVNDSVGNTEQQKVTFTVDTTPPRQITSLYNSTNHPTTVSINWTPATDGDISHYIIYQDGVNYVNTTSGTVTSHTNTTLTQSTTYNFTVWSVDINGNINTSNSTDNSILVETYTPDATPPLSITNIGNITNNPHMITINWTAPIDAWLDIDSLIVYLNGTRVAVLDKTITTYTNYSLDKDTDYNFTIQTNDTSGNQNTSSIIGENTLIVKTHEGDVTEPIMTLVGPTNNTALLYNLSSVTLSISTDENATCKYHTSDVNYQSMTNTMNTYNTNHTKTLTGLYPGQSYQYYFRCQDQAVPPNNNTASLYLNFSIDTNTGPTTVLLSPSNGFTYTDNEITLSWQVLDDHRIQNCSLYNNIDNTSIWALEESYNYPSNGTVYTATYYSVPNANYSWNVICQDDYGFWHQASPQNYTFIVNKPYTEGRSFKINNNVSQELFVIDHDGDAHLKRGDLAVYGNIYLGGTMILTDMFLDDLLLVGTSDTEFAVGAHFATINLNHSGCANLYVKGNYSMEDFLTYIVDIDTTTGYTIGTARFNYTDGTDNEYDGVNLVTSENWVEINNGLYLKFETCDGQHFYENDSYAFSAFPPGQMAFLIDTNESYPQITAYSNYDMHGNLTTTEEIVGEYLCIDYNDPDCITDWNDLRSRWIEVNFSATYDVSDEEWVNISYIDRGESGPLETPDLYNITPNMGTDVPTYTQDENLQSSNNQYLALSDTTNAAMWLQFEGNVYGGDLPRDPSNVVNISFHWEGKPHNGISQGEQLQFYIWNTTNSSWLRLGEYKGSTDYEFNWSSTYVDDFINDTTNITTFMVWANNTDIFITNEYIYTDYIALEVVYSFQSFIDTNESDRLNNTYTNCTAGYYIGGFYGNGTPLCYEDTTGGTGGGKSGVFPWLYNDSTTITFNETQLNITTNNSIDLRVTQNYLELLGFNISADLETFFDLKYIQNESDPLFTGNYSNLVLVGDGNKTLPDWANISSIPAGFADGIDDTSSGLAQFLNYTPIQTTGNITNGSLSGYPAANQICNTYYPGSHMCTMDEILYSINQNISNTNFTATFRVSEGAPGYLAEAYDCSGWTNPDGGALGSIWVGSTTHANTYGTGSLVACNANRAIGCCI